MLNDTFGTPSEKEPVAQTREVASWAPKPYRPSFAARLFVGFFSFLNRFVAWHRLPPLLGVANLAALRISLRAHNLFHPTVDGNVLPATPQSKRQNALTRRIREGEFNELGCPMMGARHSRFGRNVPLSEAHPEVPSLMMSPSPRVVSERLLARRQFQRAGGLNLLAAAWVQFQIHDWVNHEENDENVVFEIPLEPGDPWKHGPTMRILRSAKDPNRTAEEDEAGLPPTYISTELHWWDGSEVYGSDRERSSPHTAGGHLPIEGRKLPLRTGQDLPATGFTTNWWIGLELLHTLFTLEHNAICDALKTENPNWEHKQLYDTARLINAALMAKIHTVEWTPAILPHPTMQRAMRANWWGLIGKRLGQVFQLKNETLSGIPGSDTGHHGVPYSLTEEFVAVYRMHPLLPDEIEFRRLDDGTLVKAVPMEKVVFEHSHELVENAEAEFGEGYGMADMLYSFGVGNPGALTLHNFPSFLRELTLHEDPARPDIAGSEEPRIVDLAAVDVLRDRERGVPRYNRMRRLLRLPPARSFEEITENKEWARELREVYGDDVERVDLMVGMLAEKPIKGFGFSETAFRIFILMASRRLKSDRLFTRDFTPRLYTRLGMKWIADNDMTSVLLRHYPELTPKLMRCTNAFKPWEPLPD